MNMREFLRKSGLAAIIVASIISVTFLPKNVSQWVVLAVVGAWAITNAVLFCIRHKEFFKSKSFKRTAKSPRQDSRSSDSSLDFKYSLYGTDLTVYIGNLSCYCDKCITVELIVNEGVDKNDLKKMIKLDILNLAKVS